MSHLRELLDPRSVVLVGATPNFNRTGGIPIEMHLIGGNPDIPFYLVNPKYPEISGMQCYPDVGSLPAVPDLAIIAVRAEEVLGALVKCHAQGIRSAVVFASGFAEEGSESTVKRQAELVAFAAASGMQVAGPNCLGHANFSRRIFPSFLRKLETYAKGAAAIVSQSGNMAAILMRSTDQAGIGLSYMVSTGNEACTELSQFLAFLADDPDTRIVLAYVEQIRNGPGFLDAAQRLRAKGKPLFLIKAGTSEKGAEATASHTAAMAGSVAAYAAAFRQLGIVNVNDPSHLIDLASLWHLDRQPARARVSVVSLSGAACALLADAFAGEGVALPSLCADAQRDLRAVIPSYGMVTNPVDLTGQITNDAGNLGKALEALVAYDDVDAVVFFIGGFFLDQVASDLVALAGRTRKLLVVINTGPAKCEAELRKSGIAVFNEITRAVSSTSRFLLWSQDQLKTRWIPPACALDGRHFTHEDIDLAREQGRSLLTEAQAKRVLASANLPMTAEKVARTADEAALAQAAMAGPVAIKILSADIPHKTDAGGVLLNIADPDAARRAFETVTANARAWLPDARIDGVIVQPMVTDGQPVLIGVTRDAVFGLMMTVGLGGVLTEIYKDLSHRILPVDERMAHEMLRELRCFALLDGFRGSQVVDRAALVALMVAVSDFMMQRGSEIEELELNPVMVRPGQAGVVAIDALIRLVAVPAGERP